MANIFLNISSSLDKHLNDMVGKPSVAWENKEFKPVNGELWIRPTNIQGDSLAITTDQDETIGIYQVDIFAPSNNGKYDALVMADKIASQFKQDASMSYNGQAVRIRNVSRRTISNNDDGWLHIAVEITYYAFSDKR